MPRLKNRLPLYRLHRRSGLAIVTLSGRDIYLGEYDSPASRCRYEEEIEKLIRTDRAMPPDDGSMATINVLLASYYRHAKSYYDSDKSRGHVDCIRQMMRPLKRLYGDTLAADFGPKKLQAVRE